MGKNTLHGYFYKPSLGAEGTVEKGKFDDKLDVADAQIHANKNPLINMIRCSDYDHPDDAINAIGADNKTLLVTESETCDTNFTVPANVMVKFERGGKWTINNGVTVTFNGSIQAGLWQIFTYTGTGTINGDPLVDRVYPQWWINAGSGLTGSRWTSPSNTAGIQEALNFLPALGGIVFLQAGFYRTRTTIHLSDNQILQGAGNWGTTIDPYAFSETEDAIENVSENGYGIRIENLYIVPASAGNLRDLIHFTKGGFVFKNLRLKAAPRHGMYLDDCYYATVSDCMITYSGEIGIKLNICNGMLFDHVFISKSGYKGVSSTTPYGLYDYCGRANSYVGCAFEGSTGNNNGVGIYLRGVRGAIITGCYMEANSAYNIYSAYQNVTNNGSNISIISNYLTCSAGHYGIYLHSGSLINIANNHIAGADKSITVLVAVVKVKLENNTATVIANASTKASTVIGGNVVQTGYIYREKIIDGTLLAQDEYVDSSFDIEDGSTYLVTIQVISSNAVTSLGQWLASRNGTGTKVSEVLAPLYFTCTMSTYKIRVTNGDAASKYARVSVLRLM